MNSFFLPFQTQNLKVIENNRCKSPKALQESLSSGALLSPQDLEKKLIYINNNLKNPLSSQSLFKNYLDDAIKQKITNSSTKDLLNFYRIRTEEDPIIINTRSSPLSFSSEFESGNLFKVYHHEENEYVLVIHPDFGNCKYSHWFYFEVVAKVSDTFRFHIININKKDLSLEKGMQIVVRELGGWRRGGENLKFQDSSRFSNYMDTTGYFTLSFSYSFTEFSKVAFAYSYPYTHSQLCDWLKVLKHVHHDILMVSPLCKTLNGNNCELITITSDIALYKEIRHNQISDKKAVVFMARVHPCESPSSFIIQGLINFLVSKSFDAKMLRKNFVFKIVPMANPDGVKGGNTRCSLLGIDLNRRWIEANEILHPEIFQAKELIKSVKEMHDLVLFCDIHSHAKKQNVFMYGCRTQNPDIPTKKQNLISKLIPMLLAKKNQNFSYKDSSFKMEKDKESTGRIVVFKEFGILNSYTLETSFYGRENGESFSIKDWENIGSDLAQMCICLSSPISIRSSLRTALDWYKKQKTSKKKLAKTRVKTKKLKKNKVSIDLPDSESDEDLQDSEKLPDIASPHPKMSKIDSFNNSKKKTKGFSVGKKTHHGRSQRNLKASLDCVTGRKILESFPYIEGSEKKRSPLRTKLSMVSLKAKENAEKLPLIKHIFN